MKDAKGHGSDPRGAHTQGVQQVGQPVTQPKFRMNTYTHEIQDAQGNTAARMSLGKHNGLAVDQGDGIRRSGGTAIHDVVGMAAYRARSNGGDFPADWIGGELHYLTGNKFAGHTVVRTPEGGKKYGHLPGE